MFLFQFFADKCSDGVINVWKTLKLSGMKWQTNQADKNVSAGVSDQLNLHFFIAVLA